MEVHAPKMNERAVKIPRAKSQPVPHDTKTRMMTENTRMNHAQILKGSNSVRYGIIIKFFNLHGQAKYFSERLQKAYLYSARRKDSAPS